MIERLRMKYNLRRPIYMVIIILIITLPLVITVGCDIVNKIIGSPKNQLEQTSAALDNRSTQLALQATQYYQGMAETAYATRLAQDVEATIQAGQLLPAPSLTVAGEQNSIPTVTNEIPPAFPPIKTTPQNPPVLPSAEIDWEEKIYSAKILLFEDMAGRSAARYIKDGLESANYPFTDVGSAQGWLKNNILSNGPWDLIIVASEARTKIQGEFFDILLDEIHKGTAVILEIWDGDVLHHGKLGFLLSQCGVEIHADWYNPGMRAIFWLTPDHPIFHEPNQIPRVKTNFYWADDIGDLLRLTSEGDATLLAGTMAGHPNDHAVLTTCFGGRVIIQAFSDHDYERYGMMQLWQNYVYYTLKNHFLFSP